MDIQWLLFDLDGTLFDYDSAEKNALKLTFLEHNLEYFDDYLKTYRIVNKKIWTEFEQGMITQEEIKKKRFSILADTLNLSMDAVKFSYDYLTQLSRQVQLIEGADELLKKLQPKFKFALVTNGLTIVQKPRISASAIGNYFSEIIISEEIGYAKPDPTFFDITFERIGNPDRDQVMIIGDSLTSDIMGGTLYKIKTCWYNPNGAQASEDVRIDYEISSLEKLLPILNISL